MASDYRQIRILGVDFFDDSFECSLEIAHNHGGLFLAPSGPGLADLGKNPHYDAALRAADVNLIDSGYLALLWKQRTGQSVQRHSGLKFIKAIVESPEFTSNRKQLWVMPTAVHQQSTHGYLKSLGISLESGHFYIAPYYQTAAIEDEALLARIQAERPHYVILAIAGGKQEVLGHWLREQLDYSPAIICIGAAIAFLSGQQANIPQWADRTYLGWLFRIAADPKTFVPRYWKARKLRILVKKWGAASPPLSVFPKQSSH